MLSPFDAVEIHILAAGNLAASEFVAEIQAPAETEL
jgi:hypothetical protein